MWLAPAFHQGPRPLLADFHARVLSRPRACSRLLRVTGRFHCRHSRQRSLRRIHPSSSSSTPFTSVRRKYEVQPRSTGLSAAIVAGRLREAFPATISRTLSFSRFRLLSAILRRTCLCHVTLYPRNFRCQGRATALLSLNLELQFPLQVIGDRHHRALS